jgi:hypothetical protein
VPERGIEQMRKFAHWPHLEALAHTLSFDVRLMAQSRSLLQRARSVQIPVLAMSGDATPSMREAAEALARVIPRAECRTLTGQSHDVDPRALVEPLGSFFAG